MTAFASMNNSAACKACRATHIQELWSRFVDGEEKQSRQRGGWNYRDDYTPDIGWGGRFVLLALVALLLFSSVGWMFI